MPSATRHIYHVRVKQQVALQASGPCEKTSDGVPSGPAAFQPDGARDLISTHAARI